MRNWWIIAFLMLFALALYIWRATREAHKPSRDFDAEMAEIAAATVRLAHSDFGVTLDYSPESIRRVEEILANRHEDHKKQAWSEEDLSAAATIWGAYIGETIKRVRPGRWQRDSGMAGARTMPVVFDEKNEAYPCVWVYKRLTNGEEDNVWSKFRFTVDPSYLNSGSQAGKED